MKHKKFRAYRAPQIGFTDLEAEGVFCGSPVILNLQVDELKNINSVKNGEETVEPMYVEF